MRTKWAVALSLVMGLAMAPAGSAQDKVIKIGTIFPLTGPCAVAGERCKAAVETMAEVINNKHPEINIPLAKQQGILDLTVYNAASGDLEAEVEAGAERTAA